MDKSKKVVVDFIKNNPEVAKGYDKGKVTAKVLADREERLLDTPKKKASGGAVKSYSYGGRVAAMSAEKY